MTALVATSRSRAGSQVVTGDVRGAGCSSPAALTLLGEDGVSEPLALHHEEDSAGASPSHPARPSG